MGRRGAPATEWLSSFADPDLLQQFLGVVPIGITVVRPDGDGDFVIQGASPVALEAAGAARDADVVGSRLSELMRREGAVFRTHEEAARSGEPVTARVRPQGDGDERRIIELTVVPIDSTLIGLSHDITDAVDEARTASAYNDAILRSTPDQVWIVTSDLGVRHVGGAVPDAPESPTRFVGRNMRELMPVEFTERAQRLVTDAIVLGGVQTLEYRGRHGGVFEIRAAKLNDTEVLALVRDVRDRRKAEQELHTRSELDSLVADISRRLLSAPAADTDAAIVAALAALATRLGADSATLGLREDDGWFRRAYGWFDEAVGPLGTDLPDRLPREAFPWALAEMDQDLAGVLRHASDLPDDAHLERAMLAEIGARSAAMVPIRAHGSLRGYITFYWRARTAADDEQVLPPLRVVGDVLVAAHDRAQAEFQRDEADELLRTVFDTLDEAILVTAADGVVISGNHAAAEMFERPIHELVGATHHDRVLPVHDDGTSFTASEIPTFATLADGVPRSNVLEGYEARDGTLRWLSVTTRPLRRPGTEQPYAVVTSFTDVTQLRSLEEQLSQAAKMEALGRLAGGVAHDFNNLLTVMAGYSGLILADLPADSDLRPDLEEIASATTRAAALVDQLLSFSRHKVASNQAVDVNEVVDGMHALLRRALPATIELETRLEARPAIARIDRGQLEQALLNLAVNASDAMPRGGRLVVETANATTASRIALPPSNDADGPFVVVTVSDTGEGMDRATQARAFEPFFTTKPVGQGTGLGLSTVYGVIAQARGHVGLYSEVGAGTTLRLYLPVDPESAVAVPAPAGDDEVVGGNETILVVEDDSAVRAFTVEALGRLGYTVIEAEDGASARRASRTHQSRIDLLLSDVVLPDARGAALAATICETRQGLPVLLMSGYSEAVLDQETLGTMLFLAKPFQIHELARAVRATLDAR